MKKILITSTDMMMIQFLVSSTEPLDPSVEQDDLITSVDSLKIGGALRPKKRYSIERSRAVKL